MHSNCKLTVTNFSGSCTSRTFFQKQPVPPTAAPDPLSKFKKEIHFPPRQHVLFYTCYIQPICLNLLLTRKQQIREPYLSQNSTSNHRKSRGSWLSIGKYSAVPQTWMHLPTLSPDSASREEGTWRIIWFHILQFQDRLAAYKRTHTTQRHTLIQDKPTESMSSSTACISTWYCI